MSVLQCILFTIIIDVITVLFLFLLRRKEQKHALLWLLVPLSITIFISSNTINAYRHGMYDFNISFHNMLTHVKSSPVEDKLPSDLQQCIIIYYKFGCADCESIYTDLKTSIQDEENIYWVSSRSKQGKKLRELYPIDAVPTGVYIYSDSTASAPRYIKKTLYERDDAGSVHLHKINLERLLELQADGR